MYWSQKYAKGLFLFQYLFDLLVGYSLFQRHSNNDIQLFLLKPQLFIYGKKPADQEKLNNQEKDTEPDKACQLPGIDHKNGHNLLELSY